MSDGLLGRWYWRRLIGGHTAGDVPAEHGGKGTASGSGTGRHC